MTANERYEFINLIFMFDESLCRIIKHLEAGTPDKALLKAKEIHIVIEKLKSHLVGDVHNDVEKKI